MAKIHLQTLGCRLNQAESERMARGFKLAGHEIVSDAEAADLRIINSCTVTSDAGRDSRRAAKKYHDGQKIVVTGCHSEMHPEDFKEADIVIPNADKEELSALVMERFGLEGLALGMDYSNQEEPAIYPLSLKNTRAFVKIQDGCNMTCTFCLTTLARGISRSRAAVEIVEEINKLANEGCREAVLTGVHAGSYGLDIDQDLGWLVDKILSETTIPRLRLSSLEPWNFKPGWIDLWSKYEGRLCRHLHMSLQSGSDTVLPRMHRSYNKASFLEKIQSLKAAIPGMAITTDIIVGFPGETEAEHAESIAFVKECDFAGAHLFSYSMRPGTKAAGMPDQITNEIKKIRFKEMQQIIRRSESAFYQDAVGETVSVVWEKMESDSKISGLSDNYLRVCTSPDLADKNELTQTTILRNEDKILWGEPELIPN